jgi:NAD(P)-dependent dehydrogenase (short-subunit alcohol dehydrogenase family)
VLAATCDLTQPHEIESFIHRVQQDLGPIDVLINNAGVIQVGPQRLMTAEDYAEAIAVHFWAPLWTITHVLPQMRRRGQGRIVNISSIGGKIGVPHLTPYCASKFALVGLSKALRAELTPDGILVTTVCPGLMRTGSHRHAWFKGRHRSEFTWFSISGAMPLLSMSAQRAARQILNACRHGQAEAVLSLPARLAAAADALAPELTAEVLILANRLLPPPGGIGIDAREGKDSTSRWSPSWLTAWAEEAARENNEMLRG